MLIAHLAWRAFNEYIFYNQLNCIFGCVSHMDAMEARMKDECPNCNGYGTLPTNEVCEYCNGTGRE